MSQRKAVMVVLFTVFLGLLYGSSATAADYSVTIKRGQTLNYGLAPGESVTVYYYADGAPASCTVSDAPGNYWIMAANKTPVQTAMTVSSCTFS